MFLSFFIVIFKYYLIYYLNSSINIKNYCKCILNYICISVMDNLTQPSLLKNLCGEVEALDWVKFLSIRTDKLMVSTKKKSKNLCSRLLIMCQTQIQHLEHLVTVLNMHRDSCGVMCSCLDIFLTFAPLLSSSHLWIFSKKINSLWSTIHIENKDDKLFSLWI